MIRSNALGVAAGVATDVAAISGSVAGTARAHAVNAREPVPAPGAPLGAPGGDGASRKLASIAPKSDKDKESLPRARAGDELPQPADNDRDRPRILHIQEVLRDIVHGATLNRLRVGMRVVEARSGRLLFGRRGAALMDPASNQKVLATATAIMRLGSDWRFRTELTGPEPNVDGVIKGDVYLRGSGDPTMRSPDLEMMAQRLARRGIRRIEGAVIADTRRIGAEEAAIDAGGDGSGGDSSDRGGSTTRPPLVVNRGFMQVRVRPGQQRRQLRRDHDHAQRRFVRDPQHRAHARLGHVEDQRRRVAERHEDPRRRQRDDPGRPARLRVSPQGAAPGALRRVAAARVADPGRCPGAGAGARRHDAGGRGDDRAARVGTAGDPAAQDQQGLGQRPGGARARGGGRRGLRRRADAGQGCAPAARGDRRAGPDPGQLRVAQRIGPGPREPHHRRGDGHPAARAVPGSAHRPGDLAVAVGRRRRRHDPQPLQGLAGGQARAREDRHADRQVLPLRLRRRRLRRAGVLDPGRGAEQQGDPARGARRAGRRGQRDDALRARGRGSEARRRARRQRARHRLRERRRVVHGDRRRDGRRRDHEPRRRGVGRRRAPQGAPELAREGRRRRATPKK